MLLEIIKSRRSTRAFADRSIPPEEVGLLLEAARWAPSGGNQQAWLFLVVQQAAGIQKIKFFSPGLSGQPAALFVLCADSTAEGETVLMDLAMAAQNTMLSATELGLGSCAVRSFNRRAVHTLLDLPAHLTPELIISLGYPAGPTREGSRRAIAEVVHWERYGGRADE
ncbi:nitroreductase family protein [Chloroflexota bacterium]